MTKEKWLWVVSVVVAFLFLSGRVIADPAELVQGVAQIVAPGLPGAVHATNTDWWGIAGGDEDASYPSAFVLARQFGTGRIVTVGHEGLFVEPDILDNSTFLLNATNWLNTRGTNRVVYSTGHGEWVGGGHLSRYAQLISGQGYSVQAAAYPLSAASLQQASVLIIGNAWGAISPSEVSAVREWVEQGGGLVLIGVGWSWVAYHPSLTMDDYPMMHAAEPYGTRWLSNGISDPTNNHNGSPIFHVLYPDVETYSTDTAITAIDETHAEYGADLPSILESNDQVRTRFVHAHLALMVPSLEYPADHPERQVVWDYYRLLCGLHPQSYQKSITMNANVHPTATWLRERFWRTWRDCLELNRDRAIVMINEGGLHGGWRDVFQRFGVVLLDNQSLDAPQIDYLVTLLERIPETLHNLRSISVVDYLGRPRIPIPLTGQPGGVNIFGYRVGQFRENSFPPDVPPAYVDVFAVVAAHEANHVVDAYTIDSEPRFSERRARLIADAGRDRMNYLRSMLPDGFFVDNPQEFFASIANQWFTDAQHTVRLGLARFDGGWCDPINQALFIAEVYSTGSSDAWFYQTDTEARVLAELVPIHRNGAGYIDGLLLDDGWVSFQIDSDGRVVAYDRYVLEVPPLVGGQSAIIDVRGATPRSNQYFVASITGVGRTFVPPLGVALGLRQPIFVASRRADDQGDAEFELVVPPSLRGRWVWLQVAQQGRVTNVVQRRVN